MTQVQTPQVQTPQVQTPDAQMQQPRRRVAMATLAAYMLAGGVTGTVAGILARLAMRGAVYVIGGTPGFSIEGTVGIAVLFSLMGMIVAALYMVALPWLPKNIKWRALLVMTLLLLVTMPFFFLVATGELQNRPLGSVAALVLLFVPLPVLMGLGLVLWGKRLQERFAQDGVQRGDQTVSLGWAALFVAMPILLIVNVVGVAQGYMRHPLLLTRLMGRVGVSSDAAMSMSIVQGRAMLIAVVVMATWIVLTALLFYRDVRSGRSPLRAALLMLLPIFTFTAAGALPPLLAWLPTNDAMLGMVHAAGVALLFAAIATCEPDRPLPRWARTIVIAAWVIVAAWLIVPVLSDNSAMEWLAWAATAMALVVLIVLRPVSARGWGSSSALLAIFALSWLMLWVAAMMVPGMILRGYSGFQTVLSASLLWLPWLLIPAAALTNVRTNAAVSDRPNPSRDESLVFVDPAVAFEPVTKT